ncbi:PREDICTED: probable WRKY transcription factor 53 [Camelina sativa]|uniref:Probable WRKY transcription factor 53 n=1 Tax=Camelina sativa TaxID=90675 RepID=A0ABM0UCH3_CAMSA|nr:PREDICTED: probable WRKY transcription factor 53 [Camelina sativa]
MEGKDMLSWEQKTLLSELILGLDAAKKLQSRLGEATAETDEILVKQIVSSYERSLLLLNWSSSPTTVQLLPTQITVVPVKTTGGVPESPALINGSPRSEEFVDGGGSSESHHRQDYIFNSKKRKMLPKWSEKVRISPERGLEGPQDDVYSWRKYGQKDILGAKFPRSYYRCTHRSTQNCWATKQVQRSDGDATVFEVTYRGTHTCSQAAITPPPASPVKQKENTRLKPAITTTTTTQKPKDLLQSLKSNLTVRTDGLDVDDGKDVFSFPDTPPFYTYGDFGHVDSSPPIFDVSDWFNPTVEIDTTFPTFLHESIYY